jgi:hypothetical protein
MKYRFIQRYRDGEKVYHPGESADHLTSKQVKKLVKEGIVAVMAVPEVKDEQ